MKSYKLTLAYDGSDFAGWQRQPVERTVQGELEAALSRVTQAAAKCTASGRTDAGVHALGQVVSFESETRLSPGVLTKALNAELPEDVNLVTIDVAWTRQPYCVPDVSDPNEQMLVNDELRPYYERAHVISMASFPVFVQDQMLGTITFCGSEQHDFGESETDFLWSLVAQAGPTIKAFRLNAELRQAEQRLRAVFANAPVFITVFEPDGTIVLSEGAGLGRLGQAAGDRRPREPD